MERCYLDVCSILYTASDVVSLHLCYPGMGGGQVGDDEEPRYRPQHAQHTCKQRSTIIHVHILTC